METGGTVHFHEPDLILSLLNLREHGGFYAISSLDCCFWTRYWLLHWNSIRRRSKSSMGIIVLIFFITINITSSINLVVALFLRKSRTFSSTSRRSKTDIPIFFRSVNRNGVLLSRICGLSTSCCFNWGGRSNLVNCDCLSIAHILQLVTIIAIFIAAAVASTLTIVRPSFSYFFFECARR